MVAATIMSRGRLNHPRALVRTRGAEAAERLQRHSHGGPWERGERPKDLHLSDFRRNLLAARLSYCPVCPITLRGSPRHCPNTLSRNTLELNTRRRIDHGARRHLPGSV